MEMAICLSFSSMTMKYSLTPSMSALKEARMSSSICEMMSGGCVGRGARKEVFTIWSAMEMSLWFCRLSSSIFRIICRYQLSSLLKVLLLISFSIDYYNQITAPPTPLPNHSVAFIIIKLMLKSCSSGKNIRDSLRVVELKGTKDSSTKISICSNKQATKQNERGSEDKQPTKKGLGRISINLFNPTSRTVKPIITIDTGREDKYKLKEKSAREATISNSIDQNGSKANYAISETQKEIIQSIRTQFQQRIKAIISQNTKTIQQLKSSLGSLQQRLKQKEEIISNLMSTKHIKRLNTEETTSRSSSHEHSIFYSTKPAVDNANIELLWSKTHYLQTNLRVIIERFAENDSVKERLSRIQKGFFSHLSQRVTRCWSFIQRYCINLDNKCHQIEAAIQNFISNAPIMSQCKENTEKFKEKFNGLTIEFKQLLQDIACFKEKTQAFQNNANSGKLAQDSIYFDDDDQFFYPATSRRTQPEDSHIQL